MCCGVTAMTSTMCPAGCDSATDPQTPHQCIDAGGNGGQRRRFLAVCMLCVRLLVSLRCGRRHMLWRWSGRRGRSCVLRLVLLLLLAVLVLLLVACLRQLLLCRRRSGRWRGRRRRHLSVSAKCSRWDRLSVELAHCSIWLMLALLRRAQSCMQQAGDRRAPVFASQRCLQAAPPNEPFCPSACLPALPLSLYRPPAQL